MIKTRAIVKKEEVTDTIPVIKTELSSSEILTPSTAQLTMPKRRKGKNSKAAATTIEIPTNAPVNVESTTNKRSADQADTPSTVTKRCKVIQPKVAIPRISQPVPQRVVNIAPMPSASTQPVVSMTQINIANGQPIVPTERLLAPAPPPGTIPKIKIERVIASPKSKTTGKAKVNSAIVTAKTEHVSQTIAESSTSKVKKEPKAKKEPKVKKEPKAKKEPKVKKAPAVKKERKPRAKKAKFQLPPEASAYMSDAMRGRVLRAMKQRMFVISRELEHADDSCEKFEVLGSIGNNYTVTVGPRIKCTCMDYAIRRLHCKHILMVLFKVYRLPCSDRMFQSLSTTREQRLQARSQGRLVDPSVLVPPEIRQRIMAIAFKNHPDAAPAVQEETTQRRPLDTSDCPICFEEFEEANVADIDFCKVCGNNVHKECFNMWASSKGRNVTCVYCRSKWVVPGPSNSDSGPSRNRVRDLDGEHIHEGYYANFAKELGMERTRDTSTYKSNYRYNFEY